MRCGMSRSSEQARAGSEVLPTHTPELFKLAVNQAVRLLRAGQVVALPTETVYGLAANALDAAAVARIYEIKNRPPYNPVIIHVSDVEMAKRCTMIWPKQADSLARAFWPGPLTVVLPRAGEIPNIVTAGGDTVGVRWPSHPFIQAVIRECGFPLAAPSANLANCLSPTSAAHVLSQLGVRVPLIVDGGQSQVGIESTVLDLTSAPPEILRPGMIHEETLAAVIGEVQGPASKVRSSSVSLRSPGLLQKHYAPKAALVVLHWRDDADLSFQLSTSNMGPSDRYIIAHTHIPSAELGRVSVIPHDAEAYARALYAELHHCDESGAKLIIVEAPPESPEWSGIADRLRRMSTAQETRQSYQSV
jgi:L-threonylcarbamoyladenylate synthase